MNVHRNIHYKPVVIGIKVSKCSFQMFLFCREMEVTNITKDASKVKYNICEIIATFIPKLETLQPSSHHPILCGDINHVKC